MEVKNYVKIGQVSDYIVQIFLMMGQLNYKMSKEQ